MMLLKKMGWNSVGQGSQTVYIFSIVPLMINNFGEHGYGIFVFLSHVIALTAFFDLGLSLKIYVNSSSGGKNTATEREQFDKYHGIGFWVALFVFCYASISSILGSLELSFFQALLISFVVASSWPRSLYRSLLLGVSREKSYNIVFCASNVARILGISGISIISQVGVDSLLWLLLSVNIVEIGIYQYMTRGSHGYRFRPRVTKLFAIWIGNEFLLYSILALALGQIPFLWISFTQGELGLSRLGLLMLPANAIVTAFYPLTSSFMNILPKHKEIKESVFFVYKISHFIIGGVFLLVVISISVYNFWYVKMIKIEVQIPTFVQFFIMTLVGAFFAIGNLVGSLLLAHREIKMMNSCYLISTVTLFLLLIFGYSIVGTIAITSVLFFSSLATGLIVCIRNQQ